MSDAIPTAVVQQSLDAIGSDHLLGDIEDGTRESQVCLRAYRQCLMQLLRTAKWDFARREAPLVLLADGSGNTPNVGTYVVGNQYIYEYAYPPDCMRVRYIPQHRWMNPGVPSNNIVPANNASPIVTGIGQPPYGPRRVMPARFVISNDANYPPPPGEQSWQVQGISPQGRTVILTNVREAMVVYTYLCLYPSVWDSLFRAALVAFIASEIALPLTKDKKFGLAMRNEQMQIAKQKIVDARTADGNEAFATSDISVDWMNTRYSGGRNGWGGGFGGGEGNLWGGYEDCCGAGVVTGATF